MPRLNPYAGTFVPIERDHSVINTASESQAIIPKQSQKITPDGGDDGKG